MGFWTVVILMVVGGYLVIKWGQKRAEQQGREMAERELERQRRGPGGN
jgi:hypothetical protein